MLRGIFIALEGIDGSGTTVHAKLLAQWLRGQHIPVLQTHEPTSSELGRFIRRVLRDARTAPAMDALLFAADRADHTLRIIQPAMEQGTVVISDRYVESSIAYQHTSGLPLDWVASINRFAIRPDLTIVLDVAPAVGLGRKEMPKKRDKFETVPFLTKVRQVFLSRAKEQEFVVINSDAPISETQSKIQEAVAPLLRRLK
jgi:dTMP kinase